MQQAEKTVTIQPTKDELHQYIEKLDEFQARLVLSFVKTLFSASD